MKMFMTIFIQASKRISVGRWMEPSNLHGIFVVPFSDTRGSYTALPIPSKLVQWWGPGKGE